MAAEIAEEGFDSAVSAGIAVVDFWAPWCGPCKMLGAVLEKVEPEIESLGARLCKVNIDDQPGLAVRFEVMSIPALLFFKDGSLVKRLDGLQRPDGILAALKEAAAG